MKPVEAGSSAAADPVANQPVFVVLLRKFAYTAAVVAAVTVALVFPEYFIQVDGFRLQKLIVPLLQVIMVGVGCTMNWRDLVRVLKMPKAVLLGVF